MAPDTSAKKNRPGITDIELPDTDGWVSFWIDGKRHTIVLDEPGSWTLLRHRKKATTTLTTFGEVDGSYVEIGGDGRPRKKPDPSWRVIVLRYV